MHIMHKKGGVHMDELKIVTFPNGEEAIEGIVFDQYGIPVTGLLFEDNELLELAF